MWLIFLLRPNPSEYPCITNQKVFLYGWWEQELFSILRELWGCFLCFFWMALPGFKQLSHTHLHSTQLGLFTPLEFLLCIALSSVVCSPVNPTFGLPELLAPSPHVLKPLDSTCIPMSYSMETLQAASQCNFSGQFSISQELFSFFLDVRYFRNHCFINPVQFFSCFRKENRSVSIISS